jgi:hypothetical protein
MLPKLFEYVAVLIRSLLAVARRQCTHCDGKPTKIEDLGEVAAVVALTGKQYSAKLELDPELLSQVRERFQSIEDNFKAATGYGFDALTESEARYLAKHDNAQSIRDRIIAAGSAAGLRANAGDTRCSKDVKATNGGLPTAPVKSKMNLISPVPQTSAVLLEAWA